MKKYIFMLPFLLYSFCFFSCGNDSALNDTDYFTIKDQIEEIDLSVDWTDDIDGDVLNTTYNSVEGMDSKADLNPYSYVTRKTRPKAGIFPYVSDFASLDISSYPEASLDTINGFCHAIIQGEDCSDYFDTDYLYELKLFLYDYERICSESNSYSTFIIGEPFISDFDDIFQCPVRFFESDVDNSNKSYSKNYMDLCFYLLYKDSSYKIQQIAFIKKK